MYYSEWEFTFLSLLFANDQVETLFVPGQAVSMFLVVAAITFPLDEELGHNLSILGTLL